MSFGLSAAAVGLIAIGTGVAGGVLASSGTKKQSKIQAKAIAEGGRIDQAARKRAVAKVTEIFGPSLSQFNDSIQGSIDLLGQGRISTGDMLNQAYQNASQITQQGGQDAMNAMLGLPSPSQSTAPQSQPTAPPPQVDTQGQQFNVNQTGQFTPVSGEGGIGFGSENPRSGGILQEFNKFTGRQSPIVRNQQQGGGIAQQPAQDQQPLEGEFIPREYGFDQQSISMPQGTGAGLTGAVDAVTSGAQQGRQDLTAGATGALGSLDTQFGAARNDIGQGRDFALNQIQQAIQSGQGGIDRGIGAIQQGTQSGVNALNEGMSSGIGSIQRGVDSGVNAIQGGVNRGIGLLNPYISAGREAIDPYLSLSGVRGQDAFNSALTNDPAYNLAIEESERSLARRAAVTGGIGSGNTKGRFIRNAQDQAAANIDRSLARIRPIYDSGQQAASQAGQFATQGGAQQANVYSQGAGREADIYNQGYGQQANLYGQGGFQQGQAQMRGGELESGMLSDMGGVGIRSSEQLSSMAQALGMSESQVMQMMGTNLANIDVGAGNAIGGMRETAGINAANIIQGTAGQQTGQQLGLAQQLAGLDQNTLNNIVNSIQSGAGTNLQSQHQLMTLLANLETGAGTSAQQTAINMGQAQALGVTNPIGNAMNAVSGFAASGAFNPQQSPYKQTDTSNLNLNLSAMPTLPAVNF